MIADEIIAIVLIFECDFFYVSECFTYVCAQCMCLVPREAGRVGQIPWAWS